MSQQGQGVTSSSPGARSRTGETLVDRVYGQIAGRIVSGEYAPDAKLPSENDLAAALGVSRPVVRDALGRLRDEGMIYSRQGAGSFVRRRIDARALGFAPVETIADIQRVYEFRLTIEPDTAFFAAQRRSAGALASMKAALALLGEATRDQRHREDADFLFHLGVAEASNNHFYASALHALKSHVAVGMKLHGLALMGPKPQLRSVFDEHSAIHRAIEGGEPEIARTLMRRHLEGSRDRLFEGRLLDLSSSQASERL